MNRCLVPLLVLLPQILFGVTIEEKREQLAKQSAPRLEADDTLRSINQELMQRRHHLEGLFAKAGGLAEEHTEETEYRDLLHEINAEKKEIHAIEMRWRDAVVEDAKKDEAGYALWDQEETTLSQLIMEYGALDYLYIVPPEMAGLKLHMHSGVPIPRESWPDVLEIILRHNGVGVKRLNAYARQLYIFKQDLSAVQAVVSTPVQLAFLPEQARVFYLVSPPIEQAKSVFQFFERFVDARQTSVYQIGGKIAIVATKEDVQRLLQLYQTVWHEGQGKVAKVVSVSKIYVKEMERILQGFFGEILERGDRSGRPPFIKGADQDNLTVLPLGHGNSLVLIGAQETVDRAEKIIRSTEDQLLDPSEITLYLYTCIHSDPTDLAKVLEKVYNSLLTAAPEPSKEVEINYQFKPMGPNAPDGYQPTPPLMIGPRPVQSGAVSQIGIEQGTEHFIPDPKTGTLLMVVRRDALAKIKQLLHQLDIPKKMVQIEVLLFEKKLNAQNNFGLNLLKMGSEKNGLQYTGLFAPSGKGVLEFIFSGQKQKYFPQFDATYSFLMTQEDIQLNAAPSVITVNQTPATISIQEEISINNGAAPIDTNKGIAFEKSYARAQYGITIMLTPIVHLADPNENQDKGFITLQTNITFDTTKPAADDRPLVERRHIENELRVADGQTVILGGLRRKTKEDSEERVPFLGELPILGRLFGSTRLRETTTEMFFFITPHIVLDAREQLEKLKIEDLKKRPGDVPEFLEKVLQARDKEETYFFRESLKTFFTKS